MTAPPGLDGALALPRANGELVFTAPWQPRVFGVTMALVEAGELSWDVFRAGLVEAVERAPGAEYWTCWSTALEAALAEGGVLVSSAVDVRAGSLAERPAGHDHDDGHGHGH